VGLGSLHQPIWAPEPRESGEALVAVTPYQSRWVFVVDCMWSCSHQPQRPKGNAILGNGGGTPGHTVLYKISFIKLGVCASL
jgi:hypothetical protein